MPKSKEQPSLAEENRQEYDEAFELKGKSDDPALRAYFEAQIANIISKAKEGMPEIHEEALKEHGERREKKEAAEADFNTRIKPFIEEAEVAVRRAREAKDLGDIREELRRLWERANELDLRGMRMRLANILINPSFYSDHTSSFNDRFYVAHKSGVRDRDDLATGVIRNGMVGYFERTTSDGYPLMSLLDDEGILSKEDREQMVIEGGDNRHLGPRTIRSLADKYEITPGELEGIALMLCLGRLNLSSFEKRSEKNAFRLQEKRGSAYNVGGDFGMLGLGEKEIQKIADNYLSPDLAKVVLDRLEKK